MEVKHGRGYVYATQITECDTDKDYVHLLIECSPQHFIPDMVKALKGGFGPRSIKANDRDANAAINVRQQGLQIISI